MKIAVIGASHWHVPLYEPGFVKAGVNVAATWDENPDAAAALAQRHGGKAYAKLDDLLAADLDLAFVFGPPARAPDLALAVIARGLPMCLEKPCAKTAADIAKVRKAAEKAGTYVSVPLVQRVAAIGKSLMAQAKRDPAIDVSFRFIAGPPERYERVDCGWALDPELGGGGPIMNLSVHFIDLALTLTGSPAASVFCRTSNLLHGRAVEDRGLISIQHRNGALSSIDVGYRYPDMAPKREFRVAMIGRGGSYLESEPEGLVVRSPGGAPEFTPVTYDSDDYYIDYVVQTVDDLRRNRQPITGLAEIGRTLEVIDAAYESARRGAPILLD
jgi:predicted dehydrogenase